MDVDGYRDAGLWGELLAHAAPKTDAWSSPRFTYAFEVELGGLVNRTESTFDFDCAPTDVHTALRQFQQALREDVFGAGFQIDPAPLDGAAFGFGYFGASMSGEIRLTLRNLPGATRHRVSIEWVERFF